MTYQNSNGDRPQVVSVVPFTYNYGEATKGDFVYISAQIDTIPDTGSITVSILKDGNPIFVDSAVGFPNVATARGSVP